MSVACKICRGYRVTWSRVHLEERYRLVPHRSANDDGHSTLPSTPPAAAAAAACAAATAAAATAASATASSRGLDAHDSWTEGPPVLVQATVHLPCLLSPLLLAKALLLDHAGCAREGARGAEKQWWEGQREAAATSPWMACTDASGGTAGSEQAAPTVPCHTLHSVTQLRSQCAPHNHPHLLPPGPTAPRLEPAPTPSCRRRPEILTAWDRIHTAHSTHLRCPPPARAPPAAPASWPCPARCWQGCGGGPPPWLPAEPGARPQTPCATSCPTQRRLSSGRGDGGGGGRDAGDPPGGGVAAASK